MLTYERAQQLMDTARHPESGKPLANNTRLFRHPEGFAVELHYTNVVVIREDGTYRLKTGGWYTVITKDRINGYSPALVYSDRGTWYVDTRRTDADPEPHAATPFRELDRVQQRERSAWRRRNRVEFTDGMIVDASGFAAAVDPDAAIKAARAWCGAHGLRPRNGHVTLWKAVSTTYRSNHDTLYTPRTRVVAKDYAPTHVCGAGLHFGPTADVARGYHGANATMLKCRVPLASLVPLEDKCKARECYVIGRFDA